MRKLFICLLLFMVSCSNSSLIHEDFSKDTNQIIEMLDTAHSENRELEDEEKDLYDDYMDKYIVGEFFSSDDAMHGMNDLEKEIVRNIESMSIFIDESDTLKSEQSLYDKNKELALEYLEAKEVPEELEGKYPTYESYEGLHPEYIEAVKKMIMKFDPLINGEINNVSNRQIDDLKDFLSNYSGEGFEVNGTHYLTNDEMSEINIAFMLLEMDLKEGGLQTTTQKMFNEVKEQVAPTK